MSSLSAKFQDLDLIANRHIDVAEGVLEIPSASNGLALQKGDQLLARAREGRSEIEFVTAFHSGNSDRAHVNVADLRRLGGGEAPNLEVRAFRRRDRLRNLRAAATWTSVAPIVVAAIALVPTRLFPSDGEAEGRQLESVSTGLDEASRNVAGASEQIDNTVAWVTRLDDRIAALPPHHSVDPDGRGPANALEVVSLQDLTRYRTRLDEASVHLQEDLRTLAAETRPIERRIANTQATVSSMRHKGSDATERHDDARTVELVVGVGLALATSGLSLRKRLTARVGAAD